MKYIQSTLVAILLLTIGTLEAQILKPAKWTSAASKTEVKVGDEIELIFRATIDVGWYLYANDFDPDCGPMLTEMTFNDAKNYELVGKVKAINPVVKHEEVFDCEVKIFKKTGEFRQRIKITGTPVTISVTAGGQVCTEIDGKCIPFEEEFLFDNIQVAGKANPPSGNEKKNEPGKEETASQPENKEITPVETKVEFASASYGEVKGPIVDQTILKGESGEQHESLLSYMLLAFILGLTSLITPCVFPMIPMTVTFFLKDNQPKKNWSSQRSDLWNLHYRDLHYRRNSLRTCFRS
jgi:thiol:disulfide interchange protein